ncbi:hypothetical protein Tco_0334611 [Tanacetum coccineum]
MANAVLETMTTRLQAMVDAVFGNRNNRILETGRPSNAVKEEQDCNAVKGNDFKNNKMVELQLGVEELYKEESDTNGTRACILIREDDTELGDTTYIEPVILELADSDMEKGRP